MYTLFEQSCCVKKYVDALIMHTNYTILCTDTLSMRCHQKFDTDGALLTFWSFDTAPTVISAMSEMATPHRTAGHPSFDSI